MNKQTSINLIEITEDGFVQFRIAKDVVEGGVIDFDMRKWHRSAVAPGGDVDAQMGAVNAHLVSMNWPPVTDCAALKAHTAIAHTPEVVAAYKVAQEAFAAESAISQPAAEEAPAP